MTYVDEYREMLPVSSVMLTSDPEVFSYPNLDNYGPDDWRADYDFVVFDDEDWRENDCAG